MDRLGICLVEFSGGEFSWGNKVEGLHLLSSIFFEGSLLNTCMCMLDDNQLS